MKTSSMLVDSQIFTDCNLLDLEAKKNSNSSFIVSDYRGSKLHFLANENANVSFLYFSRADEEVNLDIEIMGDSTVNISLIFMNQNLGDSINIKILGENATVVLKTLSLAKQGKKQFDIQVTHYAPRSKSEVINTGISFANGTNIFNVVGKIEGNMVASDVRQITRGLILDASGVCIAKPVLLIDYYDVKAYHGATIGKINDDDLFYLMSRGLTKDEAFMLVINGLVEPFIKEISNEVLKNSIISKYQSYFGGEQ